MFDAKSILEGLVKGAAPNAQSPSGGGGLAEILGQILGGANNAGGAGGSSGGGLGGGLGDILGKLGGAAQGQRGGSLGTAPQDQGGGLADIIGELQRQFGQGGAAPASPATRHATDAPAGGSGGGLGDILGQLRDQLGKAGGASGGGGIADILGQVLGQATQGAREGATKIGDATGARDALGRATGGQSADDLLAKLKEIVQQNPMAAGTAAGGLGGLVLGTRTGRSIAGSAARIGALALIGGLAYKAFQNYQAGKPLITGAMPAEAAPDGSGFEPAAVTNETAALYIRAMIAAAASDGRVDADEQAKVIASLRQAGADAEAEAFIASELNNPATVEQLAAAAQSPEEAMQIYTAARIAIEPDERAEQAFLTKLAQALRIDTKLMAHIEATTRGAAA
ncbi:MAG: DUF533 domain-containing protein [Hyphomicrobium sp.]|nr:DUF533 domain-containing protein [Hyphomicrobium sp.]